ncbi:MAG: antibiotic biosynthesis monooxygenase [Ktedonobacteraceae bacterium]
MYASIRRATFRPGSLEEVIQRVNDSFVPSLATMSGFVEFYLIRLEHDTVSTITVFETQSGAQEVNTFFVDWVKRELASLLQSPPELAIGEVAVHQAK